MKKLFSLFLVFLFLLILASCDAFGSNGIFDRFIPKAEKPVIYLYPEAQTDVSVQLTLDGKLTSAYPSYSDTWNITASPDGTLTEKTSGREYYCLYWEGELNTEYDFSTGTVVRGEDTAKFLEDALSELGLTEREANEFIIYWLPQMEVNEYNLISFQSGAYTDAAKLNIIPAPDSVLRVFMAWKKLDAPIDVIPQKFTAPERIGFTVVEWGGAEVTE